MELPQNYRRVVDSFDGLGIDGKEQVVGELRGTRTADELEKKVNEIIRRGGNEAELVGRIFSREVPSGDPNALRSPENKRVNPVQTKGGSGAPEAPESPERDRIPGVTGALGSKNQTNVRREQTEAETKGGKPPEQATRPENQVPATQEEP